MARRVIILRGDPIINEDEVALEAITPGHLIELTTTGVQKNTDDAANVAPQFALERDEVGRDIDTAYAAGDVVKAATFAKGQRVYAFLASGQNVTKGAYLSGNTAGELTSTGSLRRCCPRTRALERSAPSRRHP